MINYLSIKVLVIVSSHNLQDIMIDSQAPVNPNIKTIESPINAMTSRFGQLFNSTTSQTPTQEHRQDISKRLFDRVQKLDHLQQDMKKKSKNFKDLKNNIVNWQVGDATRTRVDTQITTTNYKYLNTTPQKSYNQNYNAYTSERKRFMGLDFGQSKFNHISHSASSSKFDGLIQQLGDIKRTVTQIRQSCQKSKFRPMHVSRQHSSWKKSQGSPQYSYQNYRDLSDKKQFSRGSSEKIRLQEKGFAWIREQAKVNNFSIDASDYKEKSPSSPEQQ